MGYSVSDGSAVFPSIRYAGRRVSDAPDLLTEGEFSIVNGAGSQVTTSRWGDNSAMQVDPVDDCTFWYTAEYMGASGAWNTRIAAFRFPSCDGPVLYWNFDNLSNLGSDSTGRGHQGTVNAISNGEGSCDRSMTFLPNNNIQEFFTPHHDDLNIVGEMTGIASVYPVGAQSPDGNLSCTQGTIFAKGGSSWFQIEHDNDQIVFRNEGSGTDLIRVHTPIPLNTWTRVAFTRAADGKTIRIFKNGLHIGGGTLTNLATSNSDPLMVGNYGFLNDPGACEFNGSIDEIKIFDRVLSDAEILSESSTCGLGASPLGTIGVPTLNRTPLVTLAVTLLLSGVVVLQRR